MAREKVDLYTVAEEIPEDPTIALLLDEKASKASKMRALYADMFPLGKIAKLVGVRYQHVYNTINAEGKDYPAGTAFCKVCGRPLVDETSVAAGVGPVCDGRSGNHSKKTAAAVTTAVAVAVAVNPSTDDDVMDLSGADEADTTPQEGEEEEESDYDFPTLDQLEGPSAAELENLDLVEAY